MKRDMELIRKMVLAVEDHHEATAPNPLRIDGYSDEQIGYHAYLLVESGLAKGIDFTNLESKGPEYLITRLTADGHAFAEHSRPQSIWSKAITTLGDAASTASINTFKALLERFFMSQLGS